MPVPGLSVHIEGTGPRIIVGIHGWSGSYRTFAPLWPYLPDDVTLVSVDLPGFGRSTPPKARNYEAFLTPVVNALNALGVEKYGVVGNCGGAVVGMELGLMEPGRIEHLVMIDPFGYVPWYFSLLTMPWFGPLFYYSTFANPFGRFITNVALASKRKKDTNITRGFDRGRHWETFCFLRLLCSYKDARRYASLDMPKTIVHGERTFAAVRRSVEIFSEIWDDVESTELKGAGHLPIKEATSVLAAHAFRSKTAPPNSLMEAAS